MPLLAAFKRGKGGDEEEDAGSDGNPEAVAVSPSRSSVTSSRGEEGPAYKVYMKTKFPGVVEFVEGNGFETVMGVIIMYNCFTIGLQVQLCPPKSSIRIGDDCPQGFLDVSENLCTFIFVAEFFLRGLCSGFSYHIAGADKMFDVGLVWITGVMLTWIIDPIMNSMDSEGPSEMRMLTALRAFRLLRVARVIRFNFKEMWLMLRGLAGSSKALGSMIAVFVFVFYLFGILAVSLIGDSAAFGDGDEDARAVHEFFNGLDKSMWTLLQMVTADSWSSGIARPVMAVIPEMWLYFTAYIAIAMMVLMNLVTAIIVENAMNTSKEDQETILRELAQKKEEEFKNLEKMFVALDSDGSGELDEEEFTNALNEQPEIVDQFKLLGFDENETRNFFSDLDNGDGSLSTDEFIGGLMAMQGGARSADLIRTKTSVERMHKRMDKLFKHLGLTETDGDDDDSDAAGAHHASEPKKIEHKMNLHSANGQAEDASQAREDMDAIFKQNLQSLDKQLNRMQLGMSEKMDAMFQANFEDLDQRLLDMQDSVISVVKGVVKEELQLCMKEMSVDLRRGVGETCTTETHKALSNMFKKKAEELGGQLTEQLNAQVNIQFMSWPGRMTNAAETSRQALEATFKYNVADLDQRLNKIHLVVAETSRSVVQEELPRQMQQTMKEFGKQFLADVRRNVGEICRQNVAETCRQELARPQTTQGYNNPVFNKTLPNPPVQPGRARKTQAETWSHKDGPPKEE